MLPERRRWGAAVPLLLEVVVILVFVVASSSARGSAVPPLGVAPAPSPAGSDGFPVCVYPVPDDGGMVFDLRELRGREDYQLSAAGRADEYVYFINVCGPLIRGEWCSTEKCTTGCPEGTAVCQSRGSAAMGTDEYLDVAKYKTLQTTDPATGDAPSASEGIHLFYSEGIDGRNVDIHVTCEKEGGVGTPAFFESRVVDGKFIYFFTWPSLHGCPVPYEGPLSAGSVVLIILAALVGLYFIIGIPVQRFGRHKEGLDMLPFRAFFQSLPGLVVDGVRYIGAKTCCRGPQGGELAPMLRD